MAGVADSDNRLIARVLAGRDARAFGELVRRHQSQVRGFLLRLTRDATTADDLAQDTFLHAWDRLGGFRGDGSFAGWLMRIAWTTFLQSKRRGDRYRQVVEQYAEAPQSARTTPPRDEVSDLDRLLASLDESDRAVLILAYAYGMSHREIAETTGQPLGTVKSVIHRGKEKIRKDFEITNRQLG